MADHCYAECRVLFIIMLNVAAHSYQTVNITFLLNKTHVNDI